MSFRFQPFLINDRLGDPGLCLDFRFEKRAILVDLGDISALPNAKLRQASDLLVTHAHMDHFIGFDRVLRANLRQEREIRLFGPEGIIRHVASRLEGYSWNLASSKSPDLRICVTELIELNRAIQCCFSFRQRFAPGPISEMEVEEGKLQDDRDVSIRATILDHKLPCLAFAIEEARSLNVDAAALRRAGIKPGHWIDVVKEAVRQGIEPCGTTEILKESGRKAHLRLEDLHKSFFHEGSGQKITYVVDCLYNDVNAARIVDLARESDTLFIEAAFLDRHKDLARDRFHLTAKQAGRLAARAKVKRVEPLHISHRYADDPDTVIAEVRRYFSSEISG